MPALAWSGIDWSAADYATLRRRHVTRMPERLNLATLCSSRHADGRGRLALIAACEGSDALRRFTFDEIETVVARLAASLRALGVERGDRVAVYLPQRLETIAAHLATFRVGAASVPLSPLFREDALRHRLRAASVRVLVTDRALAPYVLGLRDALPSLREVVTCDDELPGTTSLERLVAAHAGAPSPCEYTGRDDPAMVIFTSGTTGLPKGAVHAHRFVPGRLPAFELVHRLESAPLEGARPLFTPADWAWVGGLVDCVLTPWMLGRPVLAWQRTHKLDPAAMVALVRRARVGALFLPPTAVHVLAHLPDAAFEPRLALDSVHTAGEPLGAETYAWARRRLGEVYELYGLTEAGALVGCCPYTPVRPGSMGRPYPGHEVDVVDADGRSVAAGDTGEIVVSRDDPAMFLGYLDDPDATEARFRGGWMRTGDLARRDADGYLWFAGRADDVFNTSGYRVGPTEIEEALARHPAVLRAAVVGLPDPERGAVVEAFVLLRPGHVPSDALGREIRRALVDRLAAYEAPRVIVFARELPETSSGKVRRTELRAADAEQRFGIHVWRDG